MPILARYLIRQFLKPFLYSLFIFSAIIIVSEVFENLNGLLRYKASIFFALKYFLYRLPYWLVQVTPVATLLATLFSLGNLSRHNEITAMKSAGINLYRITIPFLIASSMIAFVCFYLNETIAPKMLQDANQIYRRKIKKRKGSNFVHNLILAGQERRKYTIGRYNRKEKEMKNVSIDQFSKNYTLQSQIYAQGGKYEKGIWIFYNGVIRKFDSSGRKILEENYFVKKSIFLPEKPKDFSQERKKPEEMNSKELKTYIYKLKHSGIPASRELVQSHLKFAFPFSNLVMVLLGVPFAILNPRSGKIMGFSISFFTSFLYWGVMSFGQALGENKILTPFLSAWFANVLFVLVGIILLMKIKK